MGQALETGAETGAGLHILGQDSEYLGQNFKVQGRQLTLGQGLGVKKKMIAKKK